MRELLAWHSDRRRNPQTAAEILVTRTYEAPKYEVLRNPAERAAKHFEYRQLVEAIEARYTVDQFNPEVARPGHSSPEARQINAAAFSRNNKILTTRDGDSMARLWNVSYLVDALARMRSQVG